MQFKKGQSGNPSGYWGGLHGKTFAQMCRQVGESEDPKTKKKKLRLVVERLYKAAIEGEPWAVAQVADRLDGKPASESNVNVNRMVANELSDDDLASIARGRSSGVVASEDDPPVLN